MSMSFKGGLATHNTLYSIILNLDEEKHTHTHTHTHTKQKTWQMENVWILLLDTLNEINRAWKTERVGEWDAGNYTG